MKKGDLSSSRCLHCKTACRLIFHTPWYPLHKLLVWETACLRPLCPLRHIRSAPCLMALPAPHPLVLVFVCRDDGHGQLSWDTKHLPCDVSVGRQQKSHAVFSLSPSASSIGRIVCNWALVQQQHLTHLLAFIPPPQVQACEGHLPDSQGEGPK